MHQENWTALTQGEFDLFRIGPNFRRREDRLAERARNAAPDADPTTRTASLFNDPVKDQEGSISPSNTLQG